MNIKINVFISGFPRAGTTMLCLMMNYFNDCDVYSDAERHPQDFLTLETNKKYLVLKQPFGVKSFIPLYTYESLELDYKCKIISLVRDPRDVGTSIHVIDSSRYWCSIGMIIRNCEECLKNIDNQNVLFVRYEELVTNTEKQLDRVSDFLGCNYSKNFVNFYKLEHAKLKKNDSLGVRRKINAASIGRWKEKKHAKRIAELMTPKLQEYIKKLGYDI